MLVLKYYNASLTFVLLNEGATFRNQNSTTKRYSNSFCNALDSNLLLVSNSCKSIILQTLPTKSYHST